jgi:hypothetical protein
MEAEYDAAKRSYDQAPELSQSVLDTWSRVESMQTQEILLHLEKELGLIHQKACGFIDQTTKKASTDFGVSSEDMDVAHGSPGASRGNGGVSHFTWIMCIGPHSTYLQQYSKAFVTESKARAKDFLRLSQRELNSVLETLKSEYTAIILDLAGTAKAKLLKVVRGIIKQAELRPLPEGWETRFGKKLSASVSIL